MGNSSAGGSQAWANGANGTAAGDSAEGFPWWGWALIVLTLLSMVLALIYSMGSGKEPTKKRRKRHSSGERGLAAGQGFPQVPLQQPRSPTGLSSISSTSMPQGAQQPGYQMIQQGTPAPYMQPQQQVYPGGMQAVQSVLPQTARQPQFMPVPT